MTPLRILMVLSAGLLALGAGKCTFQPAANRDELTKEVLAADPKFDKVLEKYRELANRIDTFEQELALKRQTVDESIAQLKKDLTATEAQVKAKIEETKKKIEPDAQAHAAALETAAQELRAKQAQRASLGKSMAQQQKLLKSQDAPLAADAREKETQRLAEMTKAAAVMDEEMAALKNHIRLLKIKIILLKF